MKDVKVHTPLQYFASSQADKVSKSLREMQEANQKVLLPLSASNGNSIPASRGALDKLTKLMLITPRSTISKAAMRSWRVMAIKMVCPDSPTPRSSPGRNRHPKLAESGV